MAEYYAKYAEQLALNKLVVEQWNAAKRAAARRRSLRRVK